MNFVFDDGEYSVLETALFDSNLPAGMYLVAVGQCKCCCFYFDVCSRAGKYNLMVLGYFLTSESN